MESPNTQPKLAPGAESASVDTGAQQGFTLIELSIVLVIIGLIVGGVLVGQDLIKAAEIRATVGQVEKYNSAVNTFRTKYNALPGDITSAQATAFGLFAETTLSGTTGHQDGNGLIEGGASGATAPAGETLSFWRHLSDANLLDGSLGTNTADAAIVATTGVVTSTVTIPARSVPPTKTTPNNYFVVYSVSGINYFQTVPVMTITTTAYTYNNVALTPVQAYNMDIKLDDGLPGTGTVQAKQLTGVNQAASIASTSTVNTCTLGNAAATASYNRILTTGGNDGSCSLQFRFN
jgi:prepilin-type N-terminal cleavage/methylation domain-containing protein